MATHSSILAWRIRWAEEPTGLQSMGSQKEAGWGLLTRRICCQEVSIVHNVKVFLERDSAHWAMARSGWEILMSRILVGVTDLYFLTLPFSV